MTMRWSLQDLTYCECPLTASAGDELRWFFLLGCIDNRPALAEWDGATVRISWNLMNVTSMAAQVDQAFSEPAQSQPNHQASLNCSPERALLTLADCCDDVFVVETRDGTGRRSW
jgi:hypothetical protein